ncbi:MAG: hypothetical protein OSA39_05780 [Sphingobium sp.]|nr:hypothetical protein [Sphingobium sp.]
MPRMTERERLADLEARQKKVAQEIDQTRRALRGKYATIVSELPIEFLTERELRDILTHAIRAGGAASVATLKALPPATIAHNQQPDPRPQGVPATSTAEPRAGGRCRPKGDTASLRDGPLAGP